MRPRRSQPDHDDEQERDHARVPGLPRERGERAEVEREQELEPAAPGPPRRIGSERRTACAVTGLGGANPVAQVMPQPLQNGRGIGHRDRKSVV